jgi:hypothetical protein
LRTACEACRRARRPALLLGLLLASTGALRAQDAIELEAPSGGPAVAEPDAAERIRDFHSRIVVGDDGRLTVTETIAVTAAGEAITHGIYRDFPTIYGEDYGVAERLDLPFTFHLFRTTRPFEVVDVRRDGRPEPHHNEGLENGERVYFGSSEVTLPPGQYAYTLTYTTAEQLGFFADHDELYWNVTGNDWRFPIDRASATVVLPASIPPSAITLEGYTGAFGSKQRQLTTRIDRQTGELHFATTAPLASREGLTIVVSFPKGFIAAPNPADRRARLLRDNPVLLIGPLGLLLVALYYGGAWIAVGRDPRRGTIIPLFEAPQKLEAAALRYVAGMEYDERCFTAGLVGLAAKGWARIEENDGELSVVRDTARHTPLGPGERSLNSALLRTGSIELAQKNHATIRSAIRSLHAALRREYEGAWFRANRRWVIPGIVLSALVVLVAGFSGPLPSSFMFGFMLVWLTGWTFACFHLVMTVVRAWRELVRPGRGAFGRIGAGITALLATAIALPFLFAEVFALGVLIHATSPLMVPVLLVLVGLNVLFYHLLRQPTLAGRKVMDEIEGFKMYLTTAEGAELAQAAPAKTPQLYERLLPYAIALGVENEWAEQFSDVLQRSAQDDGSSSYRPSWFTGRSFDGVGPTRFASALSSSLSTSVASSSTAPGKSSGRGGGGSSGGGGGGGGGGGW